MSAATLTTKRATINDLLRETGKAELIDGRIEALMPTGFRPHKVALRITRSLDDFAAASHSGEAFGDNMGFTVDELASGRESFSPDAAYYTGTLPADLMRFVEGAPTFAVEVRSENDYGPAAERDMAAKRTDYFEAGTQVVWDVDPVAKVIRSYRASSPGQAIEFGPGSQAHAEPALPGWSVSVDWIMS